MNFKSIAISYKFTRTVKDNLYDMDTAFIVVKAVSRAVKQLTSTSALCESSDPCHRRCLKIECVE